MDLLVTVAMAVSLNVGIDSNLDVLLLDAFILNEGMMTFVVTSNVAWVLDLNLRKFTRSSYSINSTNRAFQL